MSTVIEPASRAKLATAFAAVYLIWGSTYLAIRFAIETMPPFLMAAVRFLVAGAVIYLFCRARGMTRPDARNWRDAVIVGAFLLLGGNGGVVWAEQYVESGTAALLVATVPIWMVTFDWLRGTGPRPVLQTMIGMAMGLLGLVLLIGPGALLGAPLPLVPSLVLVAASISWAWGSLYSRGARLPATPLLATGMQMLAGGALLLIAGLATGEGSELAAGGVSGRSLAALAYLIVFGAILGYSAYIWLLRHAPAAHVSTYAYVNPVVAVLLGWALADETITPRLLIAAAIIVAGVAVIVTVRGRRASQTPAPEPAE